MELPFEIVGPLPEEWASDLAAYAAALAERPWGGSSLRRLVIGGINGSLSKKPPHPGQFWTGPVEHFSAPETGALFGSC
jgi:hypothetical protein